MTEAFAKLFSIAHYKKPWAVDNMMSSNGVIQWNMSFVRLVQDWEILLVLAFFMCYIQLDADKAGKSSRTTWSNRFLVGLWCIISQFSNGFLFF